MMNRTEEKARKVAKEVNDAFGRESVVPMRPEDYGALPAGRRYLAIQATSVGLYPDTDAAVMEDRAFYERIHTGFDLIYRPSCTRFMKLVRDAGGKRRTGCASRSEYKYLLAFDTYSFTAHRAVKPRRIRIVSFIALFRPYQSIHGSYFFRDFIHPGQTSYGFALVGNRHIQPERI